MAICQECWQRCFKFQEFLINLTHNQCNINEEQHKKQSQQVKWLITEYDTEDSQTSLTLDIKKEISTEDYMITENSIHNVAAATNNNKKLTEAGHIQALRTKRELNEVLSKWNSSVECGVCQTTYADILVLNQHFSLDHPNVKPSFVCCKVKLSSRYDIADHAAFHMDPEAFKCPSCDKCFQGRRQRYAHIRIRHCKETMCTVCQKLFSSAFLLREHMLCHTPPKLYKCPACPLISKYDFNLRKHLQTIHPQLWSEEMKERSFYDANLVVSDNKASKVKTQRTARDCDEIIAQWKSNLECGICQKSHADFFIFKQHFSLEHPNVKPYIKCCNYKLTTRNDIADHAAFHMDPKALNCHKCNEFFQTAHQRRGHIRRQRCKEPSLYASNLVGRRNSKECDGIIAQWKSNLECGICQKPQTNYLDLRQHFSLEHANEKAHILCCRRKLRSRSDIADHANYHLNPDFFKCHKCGKHFTGPMTLRVHMEFHTDGDLSYKCLSCGRTYNRRKSLTDHFRAAHPQVWSERNNIPNFYESMQITRESYMRGSVQRKEDTANMISQWRESLECGICQMPHKNFPDLREHFRWEHPKEKVHIVCCERKLLNRFSIAEHARWHLEPEAFKCKKCGKCYKCQYLLKEHVSAKHPTKGSNNKYVCSICDKVCRSPLYFKEHMATHTKTNLYDCPACTYSCNQRSNLNQHLKSKHLQIWMERNDKKKGA